MKPRLESAALTVEDWKILCDMRQYHERWHGSNLLAMSSESDRRDADLMLFFMKLGWKRTVSTAYLYLRLSQAMDDPANWHTVVVRNPDGTWSTTE